MAFDTKITDLTEKCEDPVALLFWFQLGGGTDIEKSVASFCGVNTLSELLRLRKSWKKAERKSRFLSPGNGYRKTTLVNLAVERVAILSFEYSANLLYEVVVPFLLHFYYSQSSSWFQVILKNFLYCLHRSLTVEYMKKTQRNPKFFSSVFLQLFPV